MRDLLQRLDEQTVNYVFRQKCQPCVRQSRHSTTGDGVGERRRTRDVEPGLQSRLTDNRLCPLVSGIQIQSTAASMNAPLVIENAAPRP